MIENASNTAFIFEIRKGNLYYTSIDKNGEYEKEYKKDLKVNFFKLMEQYKKNN